MMKKILVEPDFLYKTTKATLKNIEKVKPEDVYRTTEKTLKKIENYRWKYSNLLLLGLSIVFAYHMLKNPQIVAFIENLGSFGYPASFIAGMLFSYGITTAPATIALFTLGKTLNPFLIAGIGAAGAVISDYIIFRIVRDKLLDEIKLFSKEIRNLTKPVSHLFFWEELRVRIWNAVSRSKIWNQIVPLIAGLIIASPLPDEIGVALFCAIKFKPKKFILWAYVFNFVGISIVAYSARII